MDQVPEIIRKAFEERRVLRLEYLPVHSRKSRIRDVDVYLYDKIFLEGYCWLEQSCRVFRIDRILKIDPTVDCFQPDPWWILYFKRFGFIKEPLQRIEEEEVSAVAKPSVSPPQVIDPGGKGCEPFHWTGFVGLLKRFFRILTSGMVG